MKTPKYSVFTVFAVLDDFEMHSSPPPASLSHPTTSQTRRTQGCWHVLPMSRIVCHAVHTVRGAANTKSFQRAIFQQNRQVDLNHFKTRTNCGTPAHRRGPGVPMAMSARRPTRAGGILAACGLADVADQDSARWPHHKGLLSRPEALGAAVGRLVLPPDAVLMQHISRGQAATSPTESGVRWPWVVPISNGHQPPGCPLGILFSNACREPKSSHDSGRLTGRLQYICNVRVHRQKCFPPSDHKV